MTRPWTISTMAFLMLLGGWLLLGQSSANAELQTRIDDTDRFQIVQSSQLTLRVDRFSGLTFELAERAGRPFWRPINWQEPFPANQVIANRVNFQVATLGPRGKTFLWEITSGRTWYLVAEKDDPKWQIVDEE